MFDYENRCPKCNAGTAIDLDGKRFCINVNMAEDRSDSCGWVEEDSQQPDSDEFDFSHADSCHCFICRKRKGSWPINT